MGKLTIRCADPGDFSQIIPLFRQLWPNKTIDSLTIKKIFLEQIKEKGGYLVLIAENR